MKQQNWIRGVLWLILGVLLWVGACGALAYRNSLYNDRRVSFRNDNAGLTADNLRELRKVIDENGGGEVAGFAQSLSQRLTVKETSGSAALDILFVDGNAPLVWNLPVLTGALPMALDSEGCAIDRETALSLFGSIHVIGRSVWFVEQELIVRGVFSLPYGLSALAVDPGRGLAICPITAAPEATTLTALEFTVSGEGSVDGKARATEWMRQASLTASGTFDDHKDQRIMLSELLTLPSYALFLSLCVELFRAISGFLRRTLLLHRAYKENHVTPNRVFIALWSCAGSTSLFLLAVLFAVAICLLPPIRSIPPSYLPTRWSDFGFWLTLMTDAFTAKARQALSVLLRPDMVFGRLTDWCAWLPFVSVATFWRARNLLSKELENVSLFVAAFAGCAVCAFAPVAGFIIRWIGWIPDIPLYAFALPVLLYAGIAVGRCGDLTGWWSRRVKRMLGDQAEGIAY